MKRVLSACLEQTLCFDTSKDAIPHEDYRHYLSNLNKKHIKYEIIDSQTADNGSLVVKIKKEYNDYSTEGYLR